MNHKEIKLILLDLDGTLLTTDKKISTGNYAALEQAAAKNIPKIAIAATTSTSVKPSLLCFILVLLSERFSFFYSKMLSLIS